MTPRNPWVDQGQPRIEQRIVFEPDGTVTARSGKVEYGQGIRTGFAMIVAEELDLPVERVRVQLGETESVPWDMGTFGSMSIATEGKALRAAAAHARNLLLQRAAARLPGPPERLTVREGRVIAPDGRTLSYAELIGREPLVGDVPEPVARLPPRPATDTPCRLEARDVLTGRARYVADLRLPGLLRGRILRPPVPGSRLRRLDDSAARRLPGVVAVVRDGDIVGVVAEREEQATAGLAAFVADWEPRRPSAPPPLDMVLRRDPGADAVLAALPIQARYHVPHISHAPIGPSAAVADVRDGDADLYVTTHRPFAVREEVAGLLGLPATRVRVHPQPASGTYGRGNLTDVALEAARLSRAVKRPVLVQWTREEEFSLSPQRPTLDAHACAVLDESGAIAAWRYDTTTNSHAYSAGDVPPRLVEMMSGRNAIPPYRIPTADIILHVVPSSVRTGPFRSLAAAPNVFAIESFVDELARASRQDPIAFRLRHIEDQRLRRVLDAVREASSWNRQRGESGRGFGVACAIYHGTYVAEVAEVTVDPEGRVRLERVWCAVDPGRLVHPDGVRNQIEGGIQQAASWTLLEELRIEDGRVLAATWSDYPIATFHDLPREIAVVFTSPPDHDESTGVGEVGSVPTAAAIANAVHDACGARVRRLPLTAAAVTAARP